VSIPLISSIIFLVVAVVYLAFFEPVSIESYDKKEVTTIEKSDDVKTKSSETNKAAKDNPVADRDDLSQIEWDDLNGSYSGDFGNAYNITIKIAALSVDDNLVNSGYTLDLKSSSAKKVFGSSEVFDKNTDKSLSKRPFEGSINGDKFTMKEPGDDPNDGIFEFTYEDGHLIGQWKAYKSNTKFNFKLEKD
jgi:hypothetical protein